LSINQIRYILIRYCGTHTGRVGELLFAINYIRDLRPEHAIIWVTGPGKYSTSGMAEEKKSNTKILLSVCILHAVIVGLIRNAR
jgi:hypothetical protein